MSAHDTHLDIQKLVELRRGIVPQGPREYWRSLDELAQTPEFQEVVERHFPGQFDLAEDGVVRRDFLKLMAASLALAGVTGCTRTPQELIVPYVKAPEQIVPGEPLYFATALTFAGYALGVLVESHMGRPTKVEGNPDHPATLGGTNPFVQASILSLYDPDRSQTVVHRGAIDTWERFVATLSSQVEGLSRSGGAGLRILTQTVTSPSLARQLEMLLDRFPEARWHQYEPAGLENEHAGARLAFGRDVDCVLDFSRADVVLSLDADFLYAWPGSIRYARDFIDHRRVSAGAPMSRLFAVESTPTITGAMADHRLPLRPGLFPLLARSLVARLGGQDAAPAGSIPGIPAEWFDALVADLESHRGSSLIVAGLGQPPIVHALAHYLNRLLGNVGQTIQYIEPVEANLGGRRGSLTELVEDMRASRVELLIMLGGNPAYTAPGPLRFGDALGNVPMRIHLSDYYDETSALCDWHVPAAHEFESWSDARAYDGTTTILQPLIEPLYAGKTPHEVLAILAPEGGRTAHELVQAYWREQFGEENFQRQWRQAIHDGIVPDTRSPTIQPEFVYEIEGSLEATRQISAAEWSADHLDIEFRPDPTVWDGRYANNGWLQELPKPLTKITWDNVALLSPATAQRLQLAKGDLIEISIGGRRTRAPVWVMPGQPDGCASLTFGYGRVRSGRVGTGIGYDAYSIQPHAAPWFAVGAIRKTGERYRLATTQHHHQIEGGHVMRVITPEHMAHGAIPGHSGHGHGEAPTFYPDHLGTANAWGMVIDQTACIGCNACVVACQAENNIPVVGKEQVAVSREMHWLRIDRYHAGPQENPETYFQPMLCVHCENAPCEVVCPVAATIHDAEGTSNMIYNRCVGTRYCSNNCPYKVRRFNYLQYTDITTPSLRLMRNPDVTVRNRGVMEKCSYCIQRISALRIEAKKDNRPIEDKEVLTACQQACPTRAIIFGNLNDPKAEVRALKQSPLNYSVLGELNTKPRTTYLARVVNPHPDLPQPAGVAAGASHETPLSPGTAEDHGHAPAAEADQGRQGSQASPTAGHELQEKGAAH